MAMIQELLTATSLPSLAIFGLPGGMEWVVLLVLGLLIFGRRLPDVGRSLGRSIIEFKKGIRGIEDEVEDVSRTDSSSRRIDNAPRQELPPRKDAQSRADQPSEYVASKHREDQTH